MQSETSSERDTSSTFSRLTRWACVAALMSVIYLVVHELFHFVTAKLLGATDVSFHWASVGHDHDSVPPISNFLIAAVGPGYTYLVVILSVWRSRIDVTEGWTSLGFTAAFRNFVVLGYVIQTMLGRDTEGRFYFDEIGAANAIDVSPLPFSMLSLLVSLVGMFYFARLVRRENGSVVMLMMIFGMFAGLYLWSLVGPVVFPGGAGFN